MSNYPIGCRFDVGGLSARIRWVGQLFSSGRLIDARESGWRDTIEFARSLVEEGRNLIAYLDPPYIEKSSRLYAVSFAEAGQIPDPLGGIGPPQLLVVDFKTEATFRWILSYDQHPDLLANVLLYGRHRMTPTEEAVRNGAKQWTISNRTITLQHSTSVGSKRREVSELLLTTLSADDLTAELKLLQTRARGRVIEETRKRLGHSD